MKKLFGGINLTWKKLIVFAVITAIYTATMAIIPFTKDTSFRDIATTLEAWILFGIIIISNSKSPKDSALKCFIFFLISQPLIYLIQVPFNPYGFRIFMYYKYWFIWTLLTIPMGFIGYYINKKNIISVIILLPMLLLIAYYGLGYLKVTMENFPSHLLSLIFCILSIIIIVFNVIEKNIFRIITLFLVALFSAVLIFVSGEFLVSPFESYKTLDQYNLNVSGKLEVTNFSGSDNGNVQLISADDVNYSLKLSGRKKGKYKFTITDEKNNSYDFEYYFDKEQNTVILNKLK